MVIGTNSDSTHTSSCAVYERPLRGNHFKAITDRTWPVSDPVTPTAPATETASKAATTNRFMNVPVYPDGIYVGPAPVSMGG
jgi:hypothetical protein